jgi:hypothetical protein
MTSSVFNQTNQNLENQPRSSTFDVPVESVSLPSKGLLYPPDNALHAKEEVQIKCMTAKEEDIMTSRALLKNGTMISELLKSCILDKSVDVDTMLTGDRNALMIALRVSGYGPEYTVRVGCPSCGEESDHTFSLGSLKIKELGKRPDVDFKNEFSFKLPRSGKIVKYKLLTIKDERELSTVSERSKKLGTQIDNAVTSRLLFSVLSIDGETDKAKLARVIQSLIAYDSRALRQEINKTEPEVDMRQHMKCKLCNEESEVTVPLDASFFWPDINQ